MLLLARLTNRCVLNSVKRNFMIKSHGLMCPKINHPINNNDEDVENKQFDPVFKTAHVEFFVGLNRLKTIQTIALAGLIPSVIGLNVLGHFNHNEVILAALISLSLSFGVHVVTWMTTNNLVVFLYLCENQQICRISYISYWGKRLELYCNVEDVELIQTSKLNIFNRKFKVIGYKNNFKIVLHNSIIYNNAKLRKVLSSEFI